MTFDFNEVQLQKLEQIRGDGVDPYPAGTEANITPLLFFNSLRECGLSNLGVIHGGQIEYTIAGRLRFKNELGRLGFGRVEDDCGKIQICVMKNKVSAESFKAWKRLDLGDWIYATGVAYIQPRS
jgi:lysyl-tRNA synthetase class 2